MSEARAGASSRAPVAAARSAARRRAGLAGGLLAALVASWSSASLGGVVTELSDAYGVTVAAVGLLVTLAYAGNLIAQLPAGVVLDRLGPRRATAIGAATLAAANAAAAVDDAFLLAAAGRIVLGLGIAGLFLGGMEYLRVTFSSPVVQGWFGGFNCLGVLSLAVVPVVANSLGWRAPYVTSAVLAAVCLALLLAAPPEARRPGRAGESRGELRAVMRDRLVYRLGFTVLLPVPLSFIASAWMATLLVERHDAPDALAGAIAAAVVVAGVLTRPLGGLLARRPAATITRWLLITTAGGGLATIVAALAPNVPVAALAALAMGMATGIPFPFGFGAAAKLRPTAPGQSVALANMLAVLSVVVGVALMGLSFSPLGDGRIGFLVLSAIWLAPLPLLSGVVRDLARREAL